jgi:ethanolamine utilization cobalamin adenosyltransferase
MDRIVYVGTDKDETARDQLRQSILETQDILNRQIQAIHEAFDQAVRSYREIDDLIPESKRGASAVETA